MSFICKQTQAPVLQHCTQTHTLSKLTAQNAEFPQQKAGMEMATDGR